MTPSAFPLIGSVLRRSYRAVFLVGSLLFIETPGRAQASRPLVPRDAPEGPAGAGDPDPGAEGEHLARAGESSAKVRRACVHKLQSAYRDIV